MNEFALGIRKMAMWTLFAIAASVIGWAFGVRPERFAGFALGAAFGLIGAVHAAWRIHRLGAFVTRYGEDVKMPRSLGLATRLALAGLAAMIALRFSQHFSARAAVVGLMAPFVIAFIVMFYYNLSGNNRTRE